MKDPTIPIYMEKTRNPDDLLSAALSLLDEAMTGAKDEKGKHRQPHKMFALFSGGHDSLTTTYIASKHPAFEGVIHIDTGTGIPETQEFVRATCAEHGWPLHVLKNDTTTYLMLVARYGFPGPAQHSMMYRYLKERPLERFLPLQKTTGHRLETFVLAAGVRKQESVKRMGYVEPIRYYRRVLWASPIHDWSALEVTRFVDAMDLRRNPVKDMLHISGECLCGSHADEMERREIATWFPEVDRQLTAYEAVVQASATHAPGGTTIARKHCTWGWGAFEDTKETPEDQLALPMCWFCTAGREEVVLLDQEGVA